MKAENWEFFAQVVSLVLMFWLGLDARNADINAILAICVLVASCFVASARIHLIKAQQSLIEHYKAVVERMENE